MAFKAGNTIVSTRQIGNRYEVVFDHLMPAAYSATNGDVINASDLGFGGFEKLDLAVNTTAKFVAYPLIVGGYGDAVKSSAVHYWSLTTASIGGQSQVLGTEAVDASDLSSFSVRFRAICV